MALQSATRTYGSGQLKYAICAVGAGRSADANVLNVMSDEVKYYYADDEVDAILDNMAEQQVRRLPAVDRDRRLVGIISITDLAANDKAKQSGEALGEIARRSMMHSQSIGPDPILRCFPRNVATTMPTALRRRRQKSRLLRSPHRRSPIRSRRGTPSKSPPRASRRIWRRRLRSRRLPNPTQSAEQQQKLDALKALTGTAFEQAYVADQVAAHETALGILRSHAEMATCRN